MTILRYQSEEALKILGDSTRLSILRILLSHPATISQLGEILGQHPARIRNHIKRLESGGMVKLEQILNVKNYLEKYYRATASAFFVNLAIFPMEPPHGQLVILGSDDPALDLLAFSLKKEPDSPSLIVLPVGSLDGLIYLRENYCQVTGCHLYDMLSGEYNLPYVRLLFTDQHMVLVTLATRQQGLLVRRDNPLQIFTVADFERPEVTLVNRKRGSGTRMWLDQELRQFGIDPQTINGYDTEVSTHAAVGSAIASGAADVGIAITAISARFDLDYIPLFEERYDLVMPESVYQSTAMQPVLEMLESPEYRSQVSALGGYNIAHMGEITRV